MEGRPKCDGCGLAVGNQFFGVEVTAKIDPEPIVKITLCAACMTLKRLGMHPKFAN